MRSFQPRKAPAPRGVVANGRDSAHVRNPPLDSHTGGGQASQARDPASDGPYHSARLGHSSRARDPAPDHPNHSARLGHSSRLRDPAPDHPDRMAVGNQASSRSRDRAGIIIQGSIRTARFAICSILCIASIGGIVCRAANAEAPTERNVGVPARPLVVLVRPVPADPTVGEALIRIHGELVEGGFDVTMVDGADGKDPRSAIETAGQSLRPSVTIGFFGGPADALELWIADRLTGKMVVRKLEANGEQGSRASEVLAIRAAELLRASLMELLVRHHRQSAIRGNAGPGAGAVPAPHASARPSAGATMTSAQTDANTMTDAKSAQPIPAVERWAAKDLALSATSSRWGLEVGAAVLGSFDGLRPAVLPLLRAQVKAGEHLRLRMTAAGLGTRPVIEAAAGSASVSQALLLLETVYRPRPGANLEPQLSLGAGAYRFGVRGDASWPYQGVENSRWSAGVDLGVGCVAPLHSYIEAAIEAHALFAHPYPAVQLFEDLPARAGRPTWLVSLTLSGWL